MKLHYLTFYLYNVYNFYNIIIYNKKKNSKILKNCLLSEKESQNSTLKSDNLFNQCSQKFLTLVKDSQMAVHEVNTSK